MVNDIISRAVKWVNIFAHKEPWVLFYRMAGKRPAGATLIPWSRGKSLAWDVTVPDTYVTSHIQSASVEAGSAAKHVARTEISKYNELSATHIFYPVSMETAGSWDKQAVKLI